VNPPLDTESVTAIDIGQLIPLSLHAVVALSSPTTFLLYCQTPALGTTLVQGDLTVLQVTG
jgi:hypothetical protein